MDTLPIRLALAGLLAFSLGLAGAAYGAEINVTMKDDVVADDGRCSLREAVDAANRDARSGAKPGECLAGQKLPAVDVIVLRRGVYRLKRGPIGDDRNAGGDLDVTESVIFAGKSDNATVIQNAVGNPDLRGDGDRVFHVDPGAKGGVEVTFSKLTIARGDVGCSGRSCALGGSGVEQRGDGELTFDRTIVMRNFASCTGATCGDGTGAAISSLGGGSLTIRASTIKKNGSFCQGDGCSIGGAAIHLASDGGVTLAGLADEPTPDFLFDGSRIEQNESWCDGASCGVGSTVEVAARDAVLRTTEVAENATGCTGTQCELSNLVDVFASRDVALDDVAWRQNVGECTGDQCGSGGMLRASGADLTLRGARILDNAAACTGDACVVGQRIDLTAEGTVALEAVDLRGSVTNCQGEQCQTRELLALEANRKVDLSQVEIASSQHGCREAGCAVWALASVFSGPLDIDRTTLRANTVSCDGESCVRGPLLHASTFGDLGIAAGTFVDNRLSCTGRRCTGEDAILTEAEDGGMTVTGSVFEGNDAVCTGKECTQAHLLRALVDEEITLTTPRVAGNAVRCDGTGCVVQGLGRLQSETLDLGGGTVEENRSACVSAGCRAGAVLQLATGKGSVATTTLTDNASECAGDECVSGPGGALRNLSGLLTISSSTLTGNRTDGAGAAIFNDAGSELLLERVSILENDVGLRSTMEFGGFGGGVYNDAANGTKGVLVVVDSEIRRNRAFRDGGGVLNEGTLDRLEDSAIVDNRTGDCVDQGGGTGCP